MIFLRAMLCDREENSPKFTFKARNWLLRPQIKDSSRGGVVAWSQASSTNHFPFPIFFFHICLFSHFGICFIGWIIFDIMEMFLPKGYYLEHASIVAV